MYFPSKILLFGEYGIVLGGSAFAIPFNFFSGCFQNNCSSGSLDSIQSLQYFQKWLSVNRDDFPFIDCDQFGIDINNGLWFNSTIPSGYGLGSSGALVAAVYHKYLLSASNDLNKIKNRLAALESFFHGSSSGIDPLVAYKQKAVWIGDPFSVELVENFDIKSIGCSVYLVDTIEFSKTIQLVDWFKSRLERSLEFKERTYADFLTSNNEIVKAMKSEMKIPIESLLKVSRYELEYLSPMVPTWFRKHYFEGIDSGNFLFKLCGSGGGGYMLCFAYDIQKTEDYFNREGLSFIKVE